eukprot:6206482-Pleurochrysis_carterae.AAC.1
MISRSVACSDDECTNVAPDQAQPQAFYVDSLGSTNADTHGDRKHGAGVVHHQQWGARWQSAAPAWVRSLALAAIAEGVSHLDDLLQIASHLLPKRSALLEGCERGIWFGGSRRWGDVTS